jgi:acyl-CoA synthetase (AMP-forming)/AMP-acid ligase II
MGIEMCGCVYCPLSPGYPSNRLDLLLEETKSRLVLVDSLTKVKLNERIVSFDINCLIDIVNECDTINLNELSNVEITGDNIGYIIFTSGSTGTPKAVS